MIYFYKLKYNEEENDYSERKAIGFLTLEENTGFWGAMKELENYYGKDEIVRIDSLVPFGECNSSAYDFHSLLEDEKNIDEFVEHINEMYKQFKSKDTKGEDK